MILNVPDSATEIFSRALWKRKGLTEDFRLQLATEYTRFSVLGLPSYRSLRYTGAVTSWKGRSRWGGHEVSMLLSTLGSQCVKVYVLKVEVDEQCTWTGWGSGIGTQWFWLAVIFSQSSCTPPKMHSRTVFCPSIPGDGSLCVKC